MSDLPPMNEVIHQFEARGRLWRYLPIAAFFGGFAAVCVLVAWKEIQKSMQTGSPIEWVPLSFPLFIGVGACLGAVALLWEFIIDKKRVTLLTTEGIELPTGQFLPWDKIDDFSILDHGQRKCIYYTKRSKSRLKPIHPIPMDQAMMQDEVSDLWKKLGERVPRFRSQTEPEL